MSRRKEDEADAHILDTKRSLLTGFLPLPFGASVLRGVEGLGEHEGELLRVRERERVRDGDGDAPHLLDVLENLCAEQPCQ